MASPQKENGNTGISNELLEKVLSFEFPSASPLKIWLFVARKTYGYHKKTDVISMSQVVKACRLSRQTVNVSLQWLVSTSLLVKGEITQKGVVYAINKDYDQWVVKTPRLVKGRPKGSQYVLTHNKYIYNKYNTVPIGTGIIINSEQYPMEELTYDPLEDSKSKKSVLGRKTMFILARAFLDAKGIVLKSGENYDANKISKSLSKLYRECKQDPNETIRRINVGAAYYKAKNLDWSLEAIWRNWEEINQAQKTPQIEISERRKL